MIKTGIIIIKKTETEITWQIKMKLLKKVIIIIKIIDNKTKEKIVLTVEKKIILQENVQIDKI